MYAPLKNKCTAATIRKAWRNAPDAKPTERKIKEHMLAHADKLWNM